MKTTESRIPKYRLIEDDLLAIIRNGQVAIGDQIPTELAISGQYGVSRLTASKAIGNLENKGYLTRTPGKGTFVADWRRNRNQHQTLRKDIAMLYIDNGMDNLWNMRLLQAGSREAELLGYHLTFCGLTGDQVNEEALPMTIREQTARGVIVNGSLTDLQAKHLLNFQLPYIMVGNYENTHTIATVSFNAEGMAYQLTNALLTLDYGPVWMVVEPFRLFYTRGMYRGYQRAIFEQPVPQNLLNACHPVECAHIVERMIKLSKKRICIMAMPSFVQGLLDHLKSRDVDMTQVMMVVLGQREPWWHHDSEIVLCEINPDMMVAEAIRQMVDHFERDKPITGREFNLKVDVTPGDKLNCLRFYWA